jgi:hypothetical protein
LRVCVRGARYAAHDSPDAGIRAERISELGRRANFPKRETARCPNASLPTLLSMPSACAAFSVTPASASVGVSPNKVHAMFSISSSDVQGDVPGLQSVAIAIGTPDRLSVAMGGSVGSGVD